MTDTTRQLIADLKVLAADSEELAKATATQAGERVTELRGRIQRCVGLDDGDDEKRSMKLRYRTSIAINVRSSFG